LDDFLFIGGFIIQDSQTNTKQSAKSPNYLERHQNSPPLMFYRGKTSTISQICYPEWVILSRIKIISIIYPTGLQGCLRLYWLNFIRIVC